MDKDGRNMSILIGVLLLGFCVFIGRNCFPKCVPVDTSELNKLVDSISLQNRILIAKNKGLTDYNESLEKEADSIGYVHLNIRKRKISKSMKDSLEQKLIEKGVIELKHIGINPNAETALSYGNQFADLYMNQKKQLANQKVININTNGIVKNQEVVIEAQGNVIRQFVERKDKVKTKLGWFIAGYIAGWLTPG